MSRRVNFTLKDDQLAELEQAINQSPHPEVRQRAIAIRLLHLGYKPEQVANLVAITANTIWMWHRRWRARGMVGLQDSPRSGRPRKATTEYCRILEETLNSEPAEHGTALQSGQWIDCAIIWRDNPAFVSAEHGLLG